MDIASNPECQCFKHSYATFIFVKECHSEELSTKGEITCWTIVPTEPDRPSCQIVHFRDRPSCQIAHCREIACIFPNVCQYTVEVFDSSHLGHHLHRTPLSCVQERTAASEGETMVTQGFNPSNHVDISLQERDFVPFAALLLAPSPALSSLLSVPPSPLLPQPLTQFPLWTIRHGNTCLNICGFLSCASHLAPEKSSFRASLVAPSCIPKSAPQSSSPLPDYCPTVHIPSSTITEVSIITTVDNMGDIVTFSDVAGFHQAIDLPVWAIKTTVLVAEDCDKEFTQDYFYLASSIIAPSVVDQITRWCCLLGHTLAGATFSVQSVFSRLSSCPDHTNPNQSSIFSIDRIRVCHRESESNVKKPRSFDFWLKVNKSRIVKFWIVYCSAKTQNADYLTKIPISLDSRHAPNYACAVRLA